MSAPELSVVCKSCGSEVSPYVTECPYCGTRIRKRAPKLERGEDGLTAKEPRRDKARRARREKAERRAARSEMPEISFSDDRPYASLALVLAPAILLLYIGVADNPLTSFGAIFELAAEGPLGQDWWHYLAAPFVYDDIGYLFVIGLAVMLFGSQLEQRLGSVATLVLAVGCGALSMLGGEAIESAISGGTEVVMAAGGNGLALGLLSAWTVITLREARAVGGEFDPVPVVVAATVLFALPLVEDWANVFVALTGAVVGGLAGLITSRGDARRA